MKVYYIKLENYLGENDTEFYRNKENAYKRYYELWDENRRKSEFDGHNDSNTLENFSFFDPAYNEYSTYISLHECSLDDLFND